MLEHPGNLNYKWTWQLYFRAISYAISGTEDFHDKVRETVCDYIEYLCYDVVPFLKKQKTRGGNI